MACPRNHKKWMEWQGFDLISIIEKGKQSRILRKTPSSSLSTSKDILKSPYNFSFLTLEDDYVEQELERG
jgi:predicted nuclease of restriction endonuclease-like (RecB) superfamily